VKLEFDAALLADHLTLRQEQIVEGFQRFLALASEFETKAQPSGNAGDSVFVRIGADDARRDHQIAPALEQRAPVMIEMRNQFGRGEDGVVTKPARHGAGMAGGADTFDDAMADIAADAGDNANREIPR